MGRTKHFKSWLFLGAFTAFAAVGCGGGGNSFPDGDDGSTQGETGPVDGSADARPDGARDGGGSNDGAMTDGGLDGAMSDGATSDGARDGAPSDGSTDAARDVSNDVTTATIGDTCAMATMITTPGTLTNQGLAGLNANYNVDSDGNLCQHANGADGVYAIVVPAGQRLNVNVTPDGALDPVVNLVAGPAANCDVSPLVCGAGADSGGPGEAENTNYVNNTTSDQTVFIVVASYDTPQPDSGFSITTELVVPPAGDNCGTAVNITTPGTLDAQPLAGYQRDLEDELDTTTCTSSNGADRVYSITVPAGKRLTVDVTGDSNLDSVVNLVAGPASKCSASPLDCIAGSDSSGSGGSERVQYTNTSTADVTVFISVAAYSSFSTGGTFSITTTVATPPDGDLCSTATTAPAMGTLAAQDLNGFGQDYDFSSGTNCRYASGAERAYAITVPAGKRLTATVTPTGQLDPVLEVVTSPASNCDAQPIVCAASVNDNYDNTPETVQYLNDGTVDTTVYLLVASYDSVPADTAFSLSTMVETPPDGDTCGTATMIATPGMLDAQDLAGFGRDYANVANGTSCRYFSGGERAYAITVPSGMQLAVTATGSTGLDPVLEIVTGDCSAAMACNASANDTTAGGVETAVYSNSSAGDVTAYILVASYDSAPTTTTFSLLTELRPPPMGDSCIVPQPITTSGTLAAQSLTGFVKDYAPVTSSDGCHVYNGADRVYSVVVPAGQTLDVTVTGMGAYDGVVNLIAGPESNCDASPTVCVASYDDPEPEHVTYTNTTSAAQTVFILVATYSSSPSSNTFDLAVTIN